MFDEGQWTVATTFGNEAEASLAQGFLESHGIASRVESRAFRQEPVNFGSLAVVRLWVPPAELERARSRRNAGATDEALAIYARIGRGTSDSETRSTAWWEYAREAQDELRYREAVAGFARMSQLGGRRADDARFQAGLAHFVLGEADSARTWWRGARGENARFWLAVSLRG